MENRSSMGNLSNPGSATLTVPDISLIVSCKAQPHALSVPALTALAAHDCSITYIISVNFRVIPDKLSVVCSKVKTRGNFAPSLLEAHTTSGTASQNPSKSKPRPDPLT
ncbi:hypothetical protein L2E82_05217 [Cichorium intybus]|uniref:Uncharacterized protein n=1 Tax=Cichorium intybus TaxID=13427 RepID=A0ACB9H805_CICIN|nr:hypothetical protein L2E82_05217 [Cichorium intybus]